MKNLKKLLVILLVLAMSCTMLLTSCKKNNDDDDYDDEIENVNGNKNGNESGNENGNESGNGNESESENKAYDYEPLISIWADYKTIVIEAAYDENGKVMSHRFTFLDWVEIFTMDYTYNDEGRIALINYKETFFYPEVEYRFDVIDGVSYAPGASVEYHENGAVKNISLDRFIEMGFDQIGRLVSIDDALFFNYDGDSKHPNYYRFDHTKENRELCIEMAYNSNGYVETLTCPDMFLITYTYDESGNVINQSIYDFGNCVSYDAEYDGSENLTKMTVTEYRDEAKTEIAYVTVTKFAYNSKNGVISVSSVEYESDGEKDDETVCSVEYDANDRVSKLTLVEDGEVWVVEYQYDSFGRLVTELDTEYDEEGELYNKGVSSMRYDVLGRLINEEYTYYYKGEYEGKSVVEYKYDNKHRIISKAYLEYDANDVYLGKTVYETAYDADGQATGFVTEYDKDGNIITESNNGMGGW